MSNINEVENFKDFYKMIKPYLNTSGGSGGGIGSLKAELVDISDNLSDLSTAIAEQDLEGYGYNIGNYFRTPEKFRDNHNYYYYLGDQNTFYGGYNAYAIVDTPHVGIVVDTKTTSAYNSGSVGEYKNTTLHNYLKGTVLTNIKADLDELFGDWSEHLLKHDKLYNSVSGLAWSSENKQTEYISALTEIQMYGSTIWSGNHNQQGEGITQLELFKRCRYNEVFGNVWIWLRSLYDASTACGAGNGGNADFSSVSSAGGRASGLILFY